MAYIGREPQIGNFQVCDAISVVNNQAAYTMQVGGVNVSPETANHMLVSLNGILQAPTTSYTVSGSTITFASNLVTGDVINFIQILGSVLDLGVPSDSTVSLAKLTATGTKNSTTFLRGDNTFASAQGKFESQLIHVRDEKSNGTAGGASSTGSWQTRTLNTVMTNEITGASLSSNQIVLPSGTYYINGRSNSRAATQHKCKLYNVSDSSDTLIGSNQHSPPASGVSTDSTLNGRFTINAEKTFELRHRNAAAQPTDGYGLAGSFSVVEVYAEVQIWKVA